ncbi:ribonuclease H-like domain-containing protein, partial [Tanacetum coccineum]
TQCDERVDPSLDSDYKSQSDSSHSSVPGEGVNIDDFPSGNNENDAQSSDDTFAAQNEQLNKNSEPKMFFEASKYEHWVDAMNNEMDALLRNVTWEITNLPKDRKDIGRKWVFKIKYKSSGEIDRYKARFVAKGFNQKEGVDFEKTFSSVVKMVTIRCLLNLVVLNCWTIFQLNINNAFLYVDLVEIVYMKPSKHYFPSGDNKVSRLKKSLNSLKQAPRQWNAKLISALIENDFSQSKSDYTLYTKSDKSLFVALLVYVDDIIITDNSIYDIEKFKTFLKSEFMIKDLGKLKYFSGIKLACKPAETPLQSKLIIINEATIDDHLLDNITDYQKLMGKLIYLTNTRPNISYVVHCLSQFMHSSLKSHLKTTFKILRYLKGFPSFEIHITKSPAFGRHLEEIHVVETASQCLVTTSKSLRDDVKTFCEDVKVADSKKPKEDSTG